MTLYELTGQFLELLEMAEDPDVDPEVLADTMDMIEGDIEDKADGYAKVMRNMEANISGIKTEVERLTNRRRVLENNIDRMKEALESAMRMTGKTKFKTELFSFGIQKNPAAVVIDDPEKLPIEYLIPQDPKIDKAAIKDTLKLDETALAGIAHLEQGESLRIR